MIDNGDSTILDTNTKLIWDKCTLGKTGNSCELGTGSLYRWNQALSQCVGKGGTWRLPNLNELHSIVDLTKLSSPLLDLTKFPNTLVDYPYWSSSTNINAVGQAFELNFAIGEQKLALKSSKLNYTRCVSGP